MNPGGALFFGKYRGIVSDKPPTDQGELIVSVPDVFGDDLSGPALPAVPYAGDGVGLFLVPPPGAWVWVEFEHGDPEYPIWSGCFWAPGQVPVSPVTADKKVLKTAAATLTFDDTSGSASITLETTSGMKLVLDTNGILIDDGQGAKVQLTGTKVSVNDGALEVT